MLKTIFLGDPGGSLVRLFHQKSAKSWLDHVLCDLTLRFFAGYCYYYLLFNITVHLVRLFCIAFKYLGMLKLSAVWSRGIYFSGFSIVQHKQCFNHQLFSITQEMSTKRGFTV